jgi:hypothetical protein
MAWMRMKDPHPLGVVWVTFVFTALPVVLILGDYGLANVWLRHALVAVVAGICTFAVVSALFWVSMLRMIRLPAAWHRPRAFEGVSWYRRLGVTRFRDALLRSPFRVLNRGVHLRGRSGEHLLSILPHMDFAEAVHVVAFAITVPLMMFYTAYNRVEFLPWFVGFNIVGNLYPVLLQRMNRLRVLGLTERGRRTGGAEDGTSTIEEAERGIRS